MSWPGANKVQSARHKVDFSRPDATSVRWEGLQDDVDNNNLGTTVLQSGTTGEFLGGRGNGTDLGEKERIALIDCIDHPLISS